MTKTLALKFKPASPCLNLVSCWRRGLVGSRGCAINNHHPSLWQTGMYIFHYALFLSICKYCNTCYFLIRHWYHKCFVASFWHCCVAVWSPNLMNNILWIIPLDKAWNFSHPHLHSFLFPSLFLHGRFLFPIFFYFIIYYWNIFQYSYFNLYLIFLFKCILIMVCNIHYHSKVSAIFLLFLFFYILIIRSSPWLYLFDQNTVNFVKKKNSNIVKCCSIIIIIIVINSLMNRN